MRNVALCGVPGFYFKMSQLNIKWKCKSCKYIFSSRYSRERRTSTKELYNKNIKEPCPKCDSLAVKPFRPNKGMSKKLNWDRQSGIIIAG